MNNKWVTTTSDGFLPNEDTCKIDCCCEKELDPCMPCESAPMGFCPPSKCPCSSRNILKDECCQGYMPMDGNAMRTAFIPAYVDTLFDSKKVEGTQLADSVNISSSNCRFSAVYRNCNGCCTEQPTITDQSCFHVEVAKAKVLLAMPARSLTNADFSINNVTPSAGSVIADGNDTYRVPLSAFDPSIFKPMCTDKCLGSKDAVIIAASGVKVAYMLEYVLCGYVSTEDGTYSFEITMANDTPKITTGTTTFYVPKICIPTTNCYCPAFLKSSFCFEAEVIAPTLRANASGDIVLNDTAVITPRAIVETLINKKVMLSVGCECDCR